MDMLGNWINKCRMKINKETLTNEMSLKILKEIFGKTTLHFLSTRYNERMYIPVTVCLLGHLKEILLVISRSTVLYEFISYNNIQSVTNLLKSVNLSTVFINVNHHNPSKGTETFPRHLTTLGT